MASIGSSAFFFSFTLTGAFAFITPATAQPIIPANDGTNTNVNSEGNRFDITGGQKSGDGTNLFHSFIDFGLNQGQIANFISQPNITNILARINGGNVSYINGLIQVTGGSANLFLMNPSGIVFGANASLSLPGAFTATTANGIGFDRHWFNAVGTNNYSELIGTPNGFAFTMQEPGNIINFGNLAVGLGQDLTFLGGSVINVGNLIAPQGQITIASVPGTSMVRLSQPGLLLSLDVQLTALNQLNNWNLPIANLPQMLTGGSGGNATGIAVNPDGTIYLTGSGISIPTEGNTTIISGNIDVSSSQEREMSNGGLVNILGDKIGIISANINASGKNDGGVVRIGGDERGNGNLPKSSITFVSKDSVISVDSFTAGNGGRAIVWSDNTTGFYGSISAKGGSNAGNGGFVEISGKESLLLAGNVSTKASNGQTGILLIDPKDIRINFTGVDSTTDLSFGFNPSFTSNINGASLSAALDSASVILQANNDITINDNVTGNTPSNGLTLQAGRSIIVNSNISLNGGNFSATINDKNAVITEREPGVGQFLMADNSQIFTNGGNVTVDVGNLGGVAIGNVLLTGAIINSGNGNISIAGIGGNGGSYNGITIINNSILQTTGAGSIDLTGIGGNGTDRNIGVFLDNSQITTADGSINLAGSGNGTGIYNYGINIQNGSKVTIANTGTIALVGTGGNSNDFNIGINLDGSQIITKEGNINFAGTGNGAGIYNHGISIQNESKITIADKGTIALAGTGGNGTDYNIGIALNNAQITTADGDINFTGTGNGSGIHNYGIIQNASTIAIAGTGAIALSGTGGNGTDYNIGLSLDNSNFNTASGSITFSGTSNGTAQSNYGITIQNTNIGTNAIALTGTGGNGTDLNTGIFLNNSNLTTLENILLNGTGNGTGVKNRGINIENSSIQNTATGTIILNGTGSNGTDENYGIFLDNTKLTSVNGDLIFTGIGNGSGRFNQGIYAQNNTQLQATGTGNINLTGTGANGEAGISINQSFINPNLPGSGAITLTADEINFLNTTQIQGKNTIQLQPLTPDLDITISGTIQDNRLNLGISELNALQPGFSEIIIGRDNGSGTITLAGDANFSSPITLQSPVGNGSINTKDFSIDNTSTNNASIRLLANQNITTGNITSNGTAENFPSSITITSNNGSVDTSAGTIDSSSSTAAGGTISIASNKTIFTGNINTSGNTQGGQITITAPIQITTKQINSSASTGNGGNVTLNSQNDIQVEYINAQGGSSGTGGTVDITTQRFFRAKGTFIDKNGVLSSISTTDGAGGSPIVIRHNGGLNTAFNVVSDATINGTAGNITSGTGIDRIVTPGSYFGPFTQGQTQVITQGSSRSEPPTTPPPVVVEPVEILPTNSENLTPQPPSLAGKGEPESPSPGRGGVGEGSAPADLPIAQIPLSEQTQISTDLQVTRVPTFLLNNTDEYDKSNLDTTLILRDNITSNLQKGNVDVAVLQIEQLRQKEYQNYFGEELIISRKTYLSVGQIQNILKQIASKSGKQPAILYVFVQPKQLDLILVTPAGKSIYRSVTETNSEVLRKVVTMFRKEVTNPLRRNTTSYLNPAQKLYQWLIAPIESELQSQKIDTLAFSLDAGLRTIPLAALHDGQKFLIQKYSIGLIPSINLIDTSYEDVRKFEILAMGADTFPQLESLPAVPLELSTIAQHIWKGKFFLNEEFTPANLRNQRSKNAFRIVHLATHGEFQPGQPNNSYIHFWNSRLSLDRLRQIDWNSPPVELLVLSACRTAVGDEQAELGFGGLAVAAGVKSALASLWYVSDRGTLALMTEFYEHLKN
ncbi:MAG TPA: CHAT domain-containing protein, partial [Leptolyngbyaceae cyanobacterium]